MKSLKQVLMMTVVGASVAVSAPSAALNIVLNADSSFTNSPNGAAALYGFQKAANYWNKTITTNATLNFDVHFGPLDDGVLGGTASNGIDTSVAQAYRQLAATGNSALDRTAVSNLRSLTAAGGLGMRVPSPNADGLGLTTALASVYDNNDSYNNRFLFANTSINKALGIDYDRDDTLFAAFGLNRNADADITFSSNFAFDFDPTDGIATGTYDFVGVAVHEMGHALGFVSGTDDYDFFAGPNGPGSAFFAGLDQNNSSWASTLDLFRYGVNSFGADGQRQLQLDPNREAFFSINGSTPYNLGNRDNAPATFATGAYNGDGNQASHWKDAYSFFGADGCVTDLNPIGVMDPTIGACVLDAVSNNDIAAFDAMGWNVSFDVLKDTAYKFDTGQIFSLNGLAAVPEPSSWALMIAGFGLVGGMARGRRMKTVAA